MPKKILVIEDNELMCSILKELLENAGFTVIDAPDGKVGMRLYRENDVDLVITDIIMPEKEGIETIRELKQENPDVKIIAVSGGGRINSMDYLQIAERLGVQRTFTKPYDEDEILKAVNELI